ncbi:MAG: amidohydrolase [Lactobacillales bacterium]|jgi:N-acetyldiaminopimelate deacetylase|nr:amidohydrolase [Lactobacillales bacterium]
MDLIKVRREFHELAEESFQEFKTAEHIRKIAGQVAGDFDYVEIAEHKTATLVFIKGTNPSKTIAWRADIDALPIKEETGHDFKSLDENFMHACGHDFHTTIALGILEQLLNGPRQEQNYLIIFQPAEEKISGAVELIDNGILDPYNITEIYAAHVSPEHKVGEILTKPGVLFAGACEAHVTFTGQGGHAAFPHLTRDPIVAGAAFLTNAQSIVARNVDPIDGAVVSFGRFTAGETTNIIPDTAYLAGTLRSLSNETNELLKQRITELAHATAKGYNVEADVKLIQDGTIPVINNEATTAKFIDFAKQYANIDFLPIKEKMTGEDFGYFIKHYPATMFWIGVDSPSGLHTATFDPDERALAKAVDFVSDYLKSLT